MQEYLQITKTRKPVLAAQTEYYKKKIMEHPGWEFVEIYVDDGVLWPEHKTIERDSTEWWRTVWPDELI